MKGWKDWAVLIWCGALILVAVINIYPGFSAVDAMFRKPEAPAWVQAVGSIIAIFAAVWISRDQEFRARRHLKRAAVKRARTFAASLAGLAETAIDDSFVLISQATERRAVLVEVIADSRTIQVELLNLDWITSIHRCRVIGAQMLHFFEEFGSAGMHLTGGVTMTLVDSNQLNAFRGSMRAIRADLEKSLDVVRRNHPGVDGYDEGD